MFDSINTAKALLAIPEPTLADYGAAGFSVVPVLPGSKCPAVPWSILKYKPPTPEQLAAWMNEYPNANIAIVLGPSSQLLVVDCDSPEAFEVFKSKLGGLPETVAVRSGSHKAGKLHFWFRPGMFLTGASFRPWHPELEFRGSGGLIIAPPSVHPSGHKYEFVDRSMPIAELPPILEEAWYQNPKSMPERPERSRRRRTSLAGTGNEESLLEVLSIRGMARSTRDFLLGHFAHEGRWNDRIFKAACDLAGLGVDKDVAIELILDGAEPDTDEDENAATATIESAYGQKRQPLRDYAADCEDSSPRIIACGNGVRILGPTRHRCRLRVGEGQ